MKNTLRIAGQPFNNCRTLFLVFFKFSKTYYPCSLEKIIISNLTQRTNLNWVSPVFPTDIGQLDSYSIRLDSKMM